MKQCGTREQKYMAKKKQNSAKQERKLGTKQG